MRRLFVLLLLLSWVSLRADEKPNVVLILANDIGINDLSCYGRKDQESPSIDRLANEGMRFTSAYCAQPLAAPSRAALLTGKSPARLHLTSSLPARPDAPAQKLLQPMSAGQLPLEQVTLAELLKTAGYATAYIGKWDLGGAGFGPKEQGFDFAFDGDGVKALTEQAEKWIDQPKDSLFLLVLAESEPNAAIDLESSVRQIMAKLDALKLTERTIFIVTSSNGGPQTFEAGAKLWQHNLPFRAGKGFLYEGGLRVPLIVRWPGHIKAGITIDQPVMLTDLMPTLLAFAGIDTSSAVGPLDGISLAKFLTGGGNLPPRSLFWHLPHYTNQGGRPADAVREGDWKLVENYANGAVELFDLAKDPSETTNLAEAEAVRANELKAKVTTWRRSVGAQELTPNPNFDDGKYRELYLAHDLSKTHTTPTTKERAVEWQNWRAAMEAAVAGRKPRVTNPADEIRLHAKDAEVHGEKLRYEAPPQKNTLGYWVRAEDWASWKFKVPAAGKYEVEIQQGCGRGSGGAQVAVEIGGQTLNFTVQETGHFQHFILRTIGTVDLPAGPQTLALKPQTKPGPAVMDVRGVVVRRIAQ